MATFSLVLIGKRFYLSASEAARFIQPGKQAEPTQALC